MASNDTGREAEGGKRSGRGSGGPRDNVFKRGEVWYVRLWVDGREIRKSAGRSRQAAQVLLARLRTDAERSRVGLGKLCRQTLADFAPRYLDWAKQHKRSWSRDERSLGVLLPALGHFRLADLTIARVEDFMRERRKAVSGPSVNREVACLRKLLSLAVERGELEANPIRRIRLYQESPGRLPLLEPDDEQRLLAACQPWLARAVRLAVLTGCRQGELLALRWRHVDFDGQGLVVEDSKSGESRRLPLHPSALAELRAARGLPDGYVIALPSGDQPLPHSVTVAFRRAVARAGLKDLRFHDLRHIAGTRLLATGASLPEVASFLGHKTLAMSRRYAHTTWTRLSDLVGRMPAGGGGSVVKG